MTPELISSLSEGDKTRITYRFISGDKVYGPFVADRPSDENHEAFIATQAPPSPVDYYAVMQSALDSIAPGTYDAVRKALRDLHSEQVKLGPIAMNVTYPSQTNPENVETELRSRVDAEKGEGVFDAVKATLKAMGFDGVTIERRSELSL